MDNKIHILVQNSVTYRTQIFNKKKKNQNSKSFETNFAKSSPERDYKKNMKEMLIQNS